MPDYRELYFTMMRETEKAIRILIAAQQECEERYLSEESAEVALLVPKKEERTDGA